MKSNLNRLSVKDKEALALFYDGEAHKALIKLIELEKTEYAKQHVGQLEIGQVRYLTGGVSSLNKLVNLLKENYDKIEKVDS